MLFQFVNVLLQVLVHKSHDLLQEEIGIAIYNMASVDFDGFFAAFLPEFLTGCDGVDANQKNVLGRNFKMDRVRREARLTGGRCGLTPGAHSVRGMLPSCVVCTPVASRQPVLFLMMQCCAWIAGSVLSSALALAALCLHLIRHGPSAGPGSTAALSRLLGTYVPIKHTTDQLCFLVG